MRGSTACPGHDTEDHVRHPATHRQAGPLLRWAYSCSTSPAFCLHDPNSICALFSSEDPVLAGASSAASSTCLTDPQQPGPAWRWIMPSHWQEQLRTGMYVTFWAQLGVLTRIYLAKLFADGCSGEWGFCLLSSGEQHHWPCLGPYSLFCAMHGRLAGQAVGMLSALAAALSSMTHYSRSVSNTGSDCLDEVREGHMRAYRLSHDQDVACSADHLPGGLLPRPGNQQAGQRLHLPGIHSSVLGGA